MTATLPSSPAAAKPEALPLARRVRYASEATVFFAAVGFFRLFGLDRASKIGAWIGRNIFALLPISNRARANLKLAYPDMDKTEIARITRAMWDNLGRIGAEYAYLDDIHSIGENPRIRISGTENIDLAVKRGKGIILFSGHLANWEIMPWTVRDYGLLGGVIVRPTNNPFVNRYLEKVRSRNGMPEQIAKGPQGTRRVFTLLRHGKCICMLVDQRASEGIPAPFFGHDVMTTPVPAALALKLGATLVPVSNERLNGSWFHVRFHPLIEPLHTGDYERDLLNLTATITKFVEDRVRERPEEWLWIHKRFQAKGAPLRKRAQAIASRNLELETFPPPPPSAAPPP
jgi:KDO2-lipid IV(A) lauroyltransferase